MSNEDTLLLNKLSVEITDTDIIDNGTILLSIVHQKLFDQMRWVQLELIEPSCHYVRRLVQVQFNKSIDKTKCLMSVQLWFNVRFQPQIKFGLENIYHKYPFIQTNAKANVRK